MKYLRVILFAAMSSCCLAARILHPTSPAPLHAKGLCHNPSSALETSRYVSEDLNTGVLAPTNGASRTSQQTQNTIDARSGSKNYFSTSAFFRTSCSAATAARTGIHFSPEDISGRSSEGNKLITKRNNNDITNVRGVTIMIHRTIEVAEQRKLGMMAFTPLKRCTKTIRRPCVSAFGKGYSS
ncbi:hypothetical protein WAI453_013534 [Rhynchosporium graminicola]